MLNNPCCKKTLDLCEILICVGRADNYLLNYVFPIGKITFAFEYFGVHRAYDVGEFATEVDAFIPLKYFDINYCYEVQFYINGSLLTFPDGVNSFKICTKQLAGCFKL